MIIFLYLAIHPWIKFDGFKGEVTGAQLMSLDEEGCYIGPLKDFELTDAKPLFRIFDREADYRYERFAYSDYAFYIKTTKGGAWFFPDETDKCLIVTGDPGSTGIPVGFRISKEDCEKLTELLERYQ